MPRFDRSIEPSRASAVRPSSPNVHPRELSLAPAVHAVPLALPRPGFLTALALRAHRVGAQAEQCRWT